MNKNLKEKIQQYFDMRWKSDRNMAFASDAD